MPVLSIGQFIRLNGVPSEHNRGWEGGEGSLGLGTQRGAQPAAWGGGSGDTEAGVGALGQSLHGGRISAGRQPIACSPQTESSPGSALQSLLERSRSQFLMSFLS